MKVEHQVLAINAFLDEYDVIVDVPPARIEEPRLDYLVINVNDSDPLIVKNGGTLYVEKGARVSVDHIVGNYERYLFADFVGVGDRNDNDLEVAVSAPVTIKVRKDAMICGEVTILPRSAENRALHELKGARTENFIIEINGISQLIAGSSSIEAVIGDKIKVIDFISPHDPRGINVNFKGFVGNPDNNRGEDRGYVADTSRDLLKDWSIDGEGLRYTIVAKRGTRELSKITLNLLKPRLEYVVLRLGNQQPVVVMNDKEFLINGEGDLRIIDVRTNAERQRDISYHLSGIEELKAK
jgi:hypothetical protein